MKVLRPFVQCAAIAVILICASKLGKAFAGGCDPTRCSITCSGIVNVEDCGTGQCRNEWNLTCWGCECGPHGIVNPGAPKCNCTY